jgi:hypothetical protein
VSTADTDDLFADVNQGAWSGEESVFTEDAPTEQPDTERAETAPKERKGPRVSIESLGTLGWGGMGMWLERSGADAPVGRVMQFQAPLAGSKLDNIIAGTWLDTLLQPLVKQTDKLEDLGVLIALPALIFMYERNPAIEPFVAGFIRQVLEATILDMAPLLQKKQRKRKTAARSIGEINDLLDIDKDADPVDALLSYFLAPLAEPMPAAGGDSETI